MEQQIIKSQKALRYGYTTGSCAAAAAEAAAQLLLTGHAPAAVALPTPKGFIVSIELTESFWEGQAAVCTVRKDSGDDPDVTNGILISAKVCRTAQGIEILGGAGVGRVTRPGLSCAVGGPAINPGPRAQITEALHRAAQKYAYEGGFAVEIRAHNGEEIAKHTFNSRLGIIGGISILGTSGIVEPMSEKALIDTIHIEMDSHFAAGETHILACPGNYGQAFVQNTLHIALERAVTISNFIGEALDYAIFKKAESFLFIGHAGKLIKLAAGVMQTHSSVADGRQEIFTAHAALCGAGQGTLRQLMQSITVDECLEILQEAGCLQPVLQSIKFKIQEHLDKRTHREMSTEFILFTNTYGELLRSLGADALQIRFQEKET